MHRELLLDEEGDDAARVGVQRAQHHQHRLRLVLAREHLQEPLGVRPGLRFRVE